MADQTADTTQDQDKDTPWLDEEGNSLLKTVKGGIRKAGDVLLRNPTGNGDEFEPKDQPAKPATGPVQTAAAAGTPAAPAASAPPSTQPSAEEAPAPAAAPAPAKKRDYIDESNKETAANFDTVQDRIKDYKNDAKTGNAAADKAFEAKAGALDKLADQYRAEKEAGVSRTQWAEVAEKMGHALAQIGAGIQGQRSGIDTASGLKFDKTDWNERYNQLLGELKTNLADLQEQKGLAERNRDATKRDIEREEGIQQKTAEAGFNTQAETRMKGAVAKTEQQTSEERNASNERQTGVKEGGKDERVLAKGSVSDQKNRDAFEGSRTQLNSQLSDLASSGSNKPADLNAVNRLVGQVAKGLAPADAAQLQSKVDEVKQQGGIFSSRDVSQVQQMLKSFQYRGAPAAPSANPQAPSAGAAPQQASQAGAGLTASPADVTRKAKEWGVDEDTAKAHLQANGVKLSG